MAETGGELLFFDTFAHDNTEEINLDLVQFPKPVYVTEVRIIPLGARVQADFPGGVRLGATNPSQFQIEFFVNDLLKPGASTFETLGGFEYDQNGKINLDCCAEPNDRKIPTDGLVLKGMYTTITLAVYGTITNNLTEQIVQPVTNPVLSQPPSTIQDVQQLNLVNQVEGEWSQESVNVPQIDYSAQPNPAPYQEYPAQPAYQQDRPPYQQEYQDYYQPRDPRSYHHQPQPENEWEQKNRPSERDRNSREAAYQKEREHKERRFSRSEDRERMHRDEVYEREHERNDYRPEPDPSWHEPPERIHTESSTRDRSSRRHQEGYRHSERHHYDKEDRKRPKTPPMLSPKRPHTPQKDGDGGGVDNNVGLLAQQKTVPIPLAEDEEKIKKDRDSREKEIKSPEDENTQTIDEIPPVDLEEFEPILSDEDICDDGEQYDLDFDYNAYTNNDDLIRLFVPGAKEIQKYPTKPKFTISAEKIEIGENLKTTIGISDDYLKSSITKYVLDNFETHNTEIKEEFIHLCEKLIPTVGDAQTFGDIVDVYTAFKTAKITKMSLENAELRAQSKFIVETVMDWLKIALSYEMANAQDQPAYKIRHIKCGVRLAEYISNSENYIKYLWSHNFNLHHALFQLFHQEFMALSIKLMILKALDTYLSHKFAIENFLLGNVDSRPQKNGFLDEMPICQTNGYKTLVDNLKKNPLVRLKFAIISILKKLNLYEILYKMHTILIKLRNISNDISAEEINLITKTLNQILSYCQSGPFTMSQPKRFLPVASQFEIIHTENAAILIKYFEMFHLLQCFILLLTYPSTLNLPLIKTPIFEVVSILSNSSEGLKYLADNIETINVLLKCLLHNEDDMDQFNINEDLEAKSHNLGLKLAFKLQALYHIQCLKDIVPKNNYDFDNFDVIDQLHGLFCLTFSTPGKFGVSQLLGMNNNVKCILQFFENSNIKSETYVQRIKRSASVGYILDLLHMAVIVRPNIPFLEKYVKSIHHALNLIYDDSNDFKISEIQSYLTPFDGVTTLAYDNIAPFVDIIDLNLDNLIVSPGRITTALRIIQHLGISKYSNKTPVICENPLSNYIELKYKHVILQLYSLDGINILVKLLQKICNHFEQPGLHSSLLTTTQGLKLLNVIHPTILLLKQMLAYVIQCRNTQFKDLTNIPVLLETYNLLCSFPNNCQSSQIAHHTKIEIVETLLVYTQPVSDQIHEKDSLNKTLWTQMVGEVIKYITLAPHNFIPGLLTLSELLPLPLPLQARDDLTKDEISWTISLRKLWSAHLHPYSNLIQDTIAKLCISSQPQLLNLLRRICVQISDLAANSALMIAKGVLDIIYNAIIPKNDAKLEPCTPNIARLLNFLACLVTHNPIKCAVLHLVHTNVTVGPKTEEKYSNLLPIFAQILRLNDVNSHTHIQAQECILSIIQSFCDVEITLLQNDRFGNQVNSEIYLANALPSKEHLLMFIEVILDHLTSENLFVTYLPIVRSMLLLTEHDFGFYHLKENILKRENLFDMVLKKLKENFSKNNPECLSTLNTLIEFLRVCLTIEEPDNNLLYKPRTTTLNVEEVKHLIGWDSFVGNVVEHPFFLIEDSLKKDLEEDQNLENILEGLTLVLKQLQSQEPDPIKTEPLQEIVLPPPEPLLNQFAGRLVFSSADACDERLTDRYWLAAPSDDTDGDLEMVPCDLQDICRILPPDFSLAKEVEKLCRISRPDALEINKVKQSEEQRHKTRRPFITPMRPRGGTGFNRQPQPRPDLFRSRPPNTSRPPSLHVDDFVALETCGAQPTGPTGYNKLSREVLASTRMSRGSRGRAFVTSERNMHYNRQMPWWGGGMFGRGPYMM